MEVANEYKDFLRGLRKIEWSTPFLIIIKEHPPKYVEDYVKMIQEVPYDEQKVNAYYGDIKKIVFSFFNFYQVCISKINDKIEEYSQELKYSEMINLYNKTAWIHDNRFEAFKREFVPVSTEEEMQFHTLVSDYYDFRHNLEELHDDLVKLKKPEKIEAFTKVHLPLCIEKTAAMCDYAHLFISKMLFARITNIRTSLLDIVHRIKQNTLRFNEGYEKKLNELYDELYELNKERLDISRRTHTSSTDTAEIEKKINMQKDKIKKFGNYETKNRLKAETAYWTDKTKELDYIIYIIRKIKSPLDKMTHEESVFNKYNYGGSKIKDDNTMWLRFFTKLIQMILKGLQTTVAEQDTKCFLYRTLEMRGTKATCWAVIGENFKAMKADLEEKYARACRSLITFFTCKGTDRILYGDDVGLYFVDEYGHQNYITHYGAKFYHVNCDGEFVENVENDKYYFDENGRYIIENGEKIFQLAPCTNKYKLTQEGLLYKYLLCHCKERCSQSDFSCGYDIMDLTELVLLPKTVKMDIRNTLDSETVHYLWQCFGWILPEVLFDVGRANSKNPIHFFAHALLNKRYAMSEKKITELKAAANDYSTKIYNARRDQARAVTLAWKAKQAKRCKPEDLDTTPQDMAYAAYQAQHEHIADLNQNYYM